MEKVLVILFFFISSMLFGMDYKPTVHFLMGQTTIQLTQGSWADADGNVDVVVVGKREQDQLLHGLRWYYDITGTTALVKDNTVYVAKHMVHTGSVLVYPKKMRSTVVAVAEPYIQVNWNSPDFTEYKKEFIKKELARCYENILGNVSRDILIHKKNPTIAISEIGTATGLCRAAGVPVAVQVITDFICRNPRAYSLIHVFVKRRAEFALYKKLLLQAQTNLPV